MGFGKNTVEDPDAAAEYEAHGWIIVQLVHSFVNHIFSTTFSFNDVG